MNTLRNKLTEYDRDMYDQFVEDLGQRAANKYARECLKAYAARITSVRSALISYGNY